jgi:hypothetical protein
MDRAKKNSIEYVQLYPTYDLAVDPPLPCVLTLWGALTATEVYRDWVFGPSQLLLVRSARGKNIIFSLVIINSLFLLAVISTAITKLFITHGSDNCESHRTATETS